MQREDLDKVALSSMSHPSSPAPHAYNTTSTETLIIIVLPQLANATYTVVRYSITLMRATYQNPALNCYLNNPQCIIKFKIKIYPNL